MLEDETRKAGQPFEAPDFFKSAQGGDFADAYAGAREDLLIWKKRALTAEAQVSALEKLAAYRSEAGREDEKHSAKTDAAEITDDQILILFRKIVGGDIGAWTMYRKEIVALYRCATTNIRKEY
jgi:hypothetical protein